MDPPYRRIDKNGTFTDKFKAELENLVVLHSAVVLGPPPLAATAASGTPSDSLARFPNEILDRIFAHLRPDASSWGPELCVLALTRLLKDSAEEALYRFVDLQGSAIALEVAAKLIRKPNLGSKIRIFKFEYLGDPNFTLCDDWEPRCYSERPMWSKSH